MLFNSLEFFIFLAIALAVFFATARYRMLNVQLGMLAAFSLFFYGWWNPSYVPLILVSVVVNYGFGRMLGAHRSRVLLGLAVGFNLALIGYFKYANFAADALVTAGLLGRDIDEIVLPLAISFFTFQQIAFVVDVYRGREGETSFLKYLVFVIFFPQLIAGPIVHYKQTIPQLTHDNMFGPVARNLAVGFTYFGIGLFKKLVIADGVAAYSTPVFQAVDAGASITFLEAWCATLAYTFQIYFDFSGYSDMAIGLARMFGVKLPVNFNSPYKATSIIEFWRRWHMTLSEFLRNYLYIPLGGGRRGELRRYVNILIVMILGGLWHGAGWTFILWGTLHGVMILVNHAYRDIRARISGPRPAATNAMLAPLSVAFVFVLVAVAWVPFRAETIEGAFSMLRAMSGADGVVLPPTYEPLTSGLLHTLGIPASYQTLNFFDGRGQIGYYVLLLLIIWIVPNTHQIMRDHDPVLNPPAAPTAFWERGIVWRPNAIVASLIAAAYLAAAYMIFIGREDEFLYFQF